MADPNDHIRPRLLLKSRALLGAGLSIPKARADAAAADLAAAEQQ